MVTGYEVRKMQVKSYEANTPNIISQHRALTYKKIFKSTGR